MDNWDLMRHWRLVLPPSRPSASQLFRIRAQILDVDRESAVAVLGSTPEFRDLLFECGFSKIHVLERNIDFYRAMTADRVYQNEERLVKGDWVETLPSIGAKFSVILSDLTSGNIPYDQRAQFYRGIRTALMTDGLFFDKVLLHERPNLTVAHLVEKYADLPLNLLHVNQFSSEMLFCSELLEMKQIVDSSAFYAELDHVVSNQRVRAFVDRAKLITPPGCKWWYGRRWTELADDYASGLRVMAIAEEEPGSPYFGFARHFQLTKKES